MTKETKTDAEGGEYLVVVKSGSLPNNNPYPLEIAYKRESYELYRARSPMTRKKFRKWAADLFPQGSIVGFMEVKL